MRAALVVVLAGACASRAPDTRYYQLAPPAAAARGGDLVLVLEQLATDAAYDDERIVYRQTPYRLDYYHYHRWSASPGVLVGNYLEAALERSGRFRAVVRELTADAPVILGGRVVALEEVDTAPDRWFGRIVLELVATDARTGTPLWTEQYEELEPLKTQSPEGLAQAISTALGRIAARAAPRIAEVTAQRQAAR